jgi:hypothetical protein
MLDENEFLSPHGIRSLSKFHEEHPYEFEAAGTTYRAEYVRANKYWFFGGTQLARAGLVTSQLSFVEALERYHHFYGDDVRAECPTGSGKFMNLVRYRTNWRSAEEHLLRMEATVLVTVNPHAG